MFEWHTSDVLEFIPCVTENFTEMLWSCPKFHFKELQLHINKPSLNWNCYEEDENKI